MARYHVPLTAGQEFGRLTVLERAANALNGDAVYLCRCSCGKETLVRSTPMRNGGTASCGCLRRELLVQLKTTHGRADTPEYGVWIGMRQRCANPNSNEYKRYGARGIRVCGRWASFSNFLEDVGLRPSPEHSIDRIDNSRGYEPGNVRWATRSEQAFNRRSGHPVTIDGVTKPLGIWARDAGIPKSAFLSRLKRGWAGKKLLQPVRKIKGVHY